MAEKTLLSYPEMAKQRSNIYNFLSLIYAKEPDQKLIDKIMEDDFLSHLSEIGIEFGDEFLKTPRERLLEDLICEYTRLFLGPGPHISPHESVYVGGYKEKDGKTGLLWGNATVEVKELIEEFGYCYREEYNGIPDHLAVELEVMGELTVNEHYGLISENHLEGYNYLLQEKRFLTEHLSRWIGEFCQRVIENTEQVFYREMARLTREYIFNDLALVDQCIAKIQGELDVQSSC